MAWSFRLGLHLVAIMNVRFVLASGELDTEPPSLAPSTQPSSSIPTAIPTDVPSKHPTIARPSFSPSTTSPTRSPSTSIPTRSPISSRPTQAPVTSIPTRQPTQVPTISAPTISPTSLPTAYPTVSPTESPTLSPSISPTTSPTSSVPSQSPTVPPTTSNPSTSPTHSPTTFPTESPTMFPTSSTPTLSPTRLPTMSPTIPEESSSGIGTDVAAGIAIGLSVCLIIVIGIFVFTKRSRRRKKRDEKEETVAPFNAPPMGVQNLSQLSNANDVYGVPTTFRKHSILLIPGKYHHEAMESTTDLYDISSAVTKPPVDKVVPPSNFVSPSESKGVPLGYSNAALGRWSVAGNSKARYSKQSLSSLEVITESSSGTVSTQKNNHSSVRFKVGDRVVVDGFEGAATVRFVGAHHLLGKPRIGVEFDNDGVGKHNGTVKGHCYFTCKNKRGLLCKPIIITAFPECDIKSLATQDDPFSQFGGFGTMDTKSLRLPEESEPAGFGESQIEDILDTEDSFGAWGGDPDLEAEPKVRDRDLSSEIDMTNVPGTNFTANDRTTSSDPDQEIETFSGFEGIPLVPLDDVNELITGFDDKSDTSSHNGTVLFDSIQDQPTKVFDSDTSTSTRHIVLDISDEDFSSGFAL